MNAFISYSHADNQMLDLLHKHLTQLQREGIISTWTDNAIKAGEELQNKISNALEKSNIFLALLSPDYIASKYCYEKEFVTALEMQEKGRIIIVPIIVEPCDWLSTPFKKFKALPKDGKSISTWENVNTAFLDVVQNIRRLISSGVNEENPISTLSPANSKFSRNYRVQKDFDSIEKMEFTEKAFHEIVVNLKRYIEEIIQIDNIKSRILIDKTNEFECLLVNRNKISTESKLRVEINNPNNRYSSISDTDKVIKYTIKGNGNSNEGNYSLLSDEYHLFWRNNDFYNSYNSERKNELTPKDMSDKIWDEWLGSVGII